MHQGGAFLLAVVLTGLPQSPPAPVAVSDEELSRGIRQVEEGDYDAAIVTLDATARRLAADARRGQDLSQAYLYLGIAYVGKG
jgi:hypothetical protein